MSELRRPIVKVKCPKCNGHKGIYGRSERNYPATLPCPRCDAVGEVDQATLTEEEKNQDMDKTFYDQTKKWGW